MKLTASVFFLLALTAVNGKLCKGTTCCDYQTDGDQSCKDCVLAGYIFDSDTYICSGGSQPPETAQCQDSTCCSNLPSGRNKCNNCVSSGQIFDASTNTCSGSPGIGDPTESDFQSLILKLHNDYRDKFGMGPLTWNSQLALQGEIHSCRMQEIQQLEHSSQPPFNWKTGQKVSCGDKSTTYFNGGENIAVTWYNRGIDQDTKELFDSWTIDEQQNCEGHYTQVIWPSTTEVGCGYAPNPGNGGGFWLNCGYNPAGNVVGQSVNGCTIVKD